MIFQIVRLVKKLLSTGLKFLKKRESITGLELEQLKRTYLLT
jgi:hypothetical protein